MERFDELWKEMKNAVRAARGTREPHYTMSGIPGLSDRVCVHNGHYGIAIISSVEGQGRENRETFLACTPADLRAIAAQCIAASMDIDDQTT